jgi:hypothetical protein
VIAGICAGVGVLGITGAAFWAGIWGLGTPCDRAAGPLLGLIVVVPVVVVMRVVIGGGSALTGRIGRHSTAGLAVVAAAALVGAQLDQGVGHGHPQLCGERGLVGGPVGREGPGP